MFGLTFIGIIGRDRLALILYIVDFCIDAEIILIKLDSDMSNKFKVVLNQLLDLNLNGFVSVFMSLVRQLSSHRDIHVPHAYTSNEFLLRPAFYFHHITFPGPGQYKILYFFANSPKVYPDKFVVCLATVSTTTTINYNAHLDIIYLKK